MGIISVISKKIVLSHFWQLNAFSGNPNTTNLKFFPIQVGYASSGENLTTV